MRLFRGCRLRQAGEVARKLWAGKSCCFLLLQVIHERGRTGFEEAKDFPIRINSLIASRYQAAFACVRCVCVGGRAGRRCAVFRWRGRGLTAVRERGLAVGRGDVHVWGALPSGGFSPPPSRCRSRSISALLLSQKQCSVWTCTPGRWFASRSSKTTRCGAPPGPSHPRRPRENSCRPHGISLAG